MPALVSLAKRGTDDAFMAAYEPSQATAPQRGGSTLLHIAVANGDLEARIAIANQLLDDGAEPGAVSDEGSTVLHVLFATPKHDFDAEPALVRRLIDGGADINRTNAAYGPPLPVAIDRMLAFEPEARGILEAAVAGGVVDWSVPVHPAGEPTKTLGAFVIGATNPDDPLHQAAIAECA